MMSSYYYIADPGRAEAALQQLYSTPAPYGIDIETTGLCPWQHQLRLVSIANRAGTVVVLDMFHLPAALLSEWLPRGWYVAHNAVFESKWFRQVAGVQISTHDTMLLGRVLYGANLKLAELCAAALGLQVDKAAQRSDWAAPALTAQQLAYSALDAQLPLQLYERIGPIAGRTAIYQNLLQVVPVIAQQELDGIPVDWERLERLRERWEWQRLEALSAFDLALPGVLPTSPKQISAWLETHADALLLQQWPRTATGQLQLNSDQLNALQPGALPALEPLRQVRKLTKLLGWTKGNLLDKRNPVTGRVHPGYGIAFASSGRFNCSKPNMQQLPREGDMRELVCAPLGRALACADYSMQELRISAIYSGERTMLDAFNAGTDLHTLTAQQVLGSTDKEARAVGKTINFSQQYGGGPQVLVKKARERGITLTLEQAQAYRTRFFESRPQLRQWQRHTISQAERTLQVSTRLGLVRHFTRDTFKATDVCAHAVSGTGAEVLRSTLAALPRHLAGLDARLIHHSHDELLLECAEQDGAAAAQGLAAAMLDGWVQVMGEQCTTGLVEAHTGATWAAAKT